MSYAEAWRTLLGAVREIGPEPSPAAAPANSPQLSLVFDAPAVCPLHGDAYVCDRCPEHFETDGWGFVHRTLLAGRTALRTCRCCGAAKSRAEWGSIAQYFLCRTCEAALSGGERSCK